MNDTTTKVSAPGLSAFVCLTPENAVNLANALLTAASCVGSAIKTGNPDAYIYRRVKTLDGGTLHIRVGNAP